MEYMVKTQALLHKRVVQHVLYWLSVLAVMTVLYSIYIKSYLASFSFMIFFLPIHMAYFYIMAYVVIPKMLFTKKYIWFFLSVFACALVAALLFRLAEIFYADPLTYKLLVKLNGPFVWDRIQGSFWEQITRFSAFMAAMEQTNNAAWVAIAIKLLKMYYERKEAATQAELSFLKNQVHPHFLFNTLNNLYALTLNQSPQSPTVVMGLSQILRYILYECDTPTVKLAKELDIIEQYIALEKLRHTQALDLTFHVNGSIQDQEIAPLLLLPLVENAFKHGVHEDMQEAWVTIQIMVKEERFSFKISNSKPAKPMIKLSMVPKGNIGLANLTKRLNMLYPNAHKLRIYDDDEHLFAVVLELTLTPVANKKAAGSLRVKKLYPEQLLALNKSETIK
ncbi:sensor histidine kinase [Olivibacter sitiensis]|uniref:sensor histidine kinase n=1 Tax=Olivibacter sitiensis TaxID=376470 RepID=UPI000686DE5A|nr:histidine kinase [Olivibacter sitiensis]